MKKTTTILLLAASIAVAGNCKEKAKENKANAASALERVKMGEPIAKERAAKMGAYLSKGKGKAGAFRQDDIAKADGRLLAYLLGCNLAELSIGIGSGNKEVLVDALAGLSAIEDRGNHVGDYPWSANVVKVLNALKESQIDKEKAISLIAEISSASANASGSNQELRHNLLFGYATFLSAVAYGTGGSVDGFGDFVDAYLAAAGPNMSPTAKGHYETAKTLIAEGKSGEAGKALLAAASTF